MCVWIGSFRFQWAFYLPFSAFFSIYFQSLLLGEKYFGWMIIVKTVWLELWLCLSGVRDRVKTRWRKSTTKHHYKSSLFSCFYSGFIQMETSNAPSWWCKESTHALVHLIPHSSLCYCLLCVKEIIPYSHVFKKSSKRKSKTASQICLRTFQKREHISVWKWSGWLCSMGRVVPLVMLIAVAACLCRFLCFPSLL